MVFYDDGAQWSFRQIIQQIEWTFARNLNRSLAAKEHVQDVAVVLLRRLYHRVLLGSVFAKWHLYTNLIVNLGGRERSCGWGGRGGRSIGAGGPNPSAPKSGLRDADPKVPDEHWQPPMTS